MSWDIDTELKQLEERLKEQDVAKFLGNLPDDEISEWRDHFEMLKLRCESLKVVSAGIKRRNFVKAFGLQEQWNKFVALKGAMVDATEPVPSESSPDRTAQFAFNKLGKQLHTHLQGSFIPALDAALNNLPFYSGFFHSTTDLQKLREVCQSDLDFIELNFREQTAARRTQAATTIQRNTRDYLSRKNLERTIGCLTIVGWTVTRCSESAVNVVIPKWVVNIGPQAFFRCKRLVSVHIHEGVKTIGAHAFRECENLRSAVIPKSVVSIGDSAFYRCDRLVSVVMPRSVSAIESGAFDKCGSLSLFLIAQEEEEMELSRLPRWSAVIYHPLSVRKFINLCITDPHNFHRGHQCGGALREKIRDLWLVNQRRWPTPYQLLALSFCVSEPDKLYKFLNPILECIPYFQQTRPTPSLRSLAATAFRSYPENMAATRSRYPGREGNIATSCENGLKSQVNMVYQLVSPGIDASKYMRLDHDFVEAQRKKSIMAGKPGVNALL